MEACGLQDFSKVRREDLEAAQERGTEVHHFCALDDQCMLDEATVDPSLFGYLSAWRAFRKATGAVILAVERIVWHPIYGYVGTFDVFMEDRNGVYWLLDRKTGPEHPAHEVQLGGYWEALKVSAKEILPPDIDLVKVRFASVHLSADGAYRVAEHDAKRGWMLFMSCLALYRWKLNHGLLKAA
jgi:hypothetical protein